MVQGAVSPERAGQVSIPVSTSAQLSTIDPSYSALVYDKTKPEITKSEVTLKRPAIPLTETLSAKVKTEKVKPLDKMTRDLESLSSSAAASINGLLSGLEASKLSKWAKSVQLSDLTASTPSTPAPKVSTNSLSSGQVGQGGSGISLSKNVASKLGFQPLTVAVFETSESTRQATPTSTIEADGNNLTTQIFTPAFDHHKALDVFARDTRSNKATVFAHANTNSSSELEAIKSEVSLDKDSLNPNVANLIPSANVASVALSNVNSILVGSVPAVVVSASPTTASPVAPSTQTNANASFAATVALTVAPASWSA